MRFLTSVACVCCALFLACVAAATEPTPPGWYPLPPGVAVTAADIPVVSPHGIKSEATMPIPDEQDVLFCSKRRAKAQEGACGAQGCTNAACAGGSCAVAANGVQTCSGGACSQPATTQQQPVVTYSQPVTYTSMGSGGCSSGSCGASSRGSRRGR